MADLTFEQVLEAAEQLNAEERAALIQRLSGTLHFTITRQDALAKLEQLRHKPRKPDEDLFGKFANPDVEINDAELENFLRDVQTRWKEDLKDLLNDDH
jgi:hypothetical protein